MNTSSSPLPPSPSRWDHLPRCTSRCNRYLARIPNHKIGVVNAILESYEHITRVGTFDIRNGILEIIVPQEWDEEFQNATARISEKIEWVFLSWERPMQHPKP